MTIIKNSRNKIKNNKLYQHAIFLVLLFLFGLWLWKLDFSFYFWDEIDVLKELNLGNYNFSSPHNEHLYVIFRLQYYLSLLVFGSMPNMINVGLIGLHVLTSAIFGYFLKLLYKKDFYWYMGSFYFMSHLLQWENLTWQFQSQIIMNLGLLYTSLILANKFISSSSKSKNKYFVLALFTNLIAAYSFGIGLIYPILLGIFIVIFANKPFHYWKHYLGIFVGFIVNTLVYYFLVFSLPSSGEEEGGLNLLLLIKYYLNAVIVNFSRALFPTLAFDYKQAMVPLLVAIIIFSIVLFQEYKKKEYFYTRRILFASTIYLSSFVLISVSRYQLGYEQAYASRYTYFYLPGVIIGLLALLDFLSNKVRQEYVYSFMTTFILMTLIYSYPKLDDIKRYVSYRNANNYIEMLKVNDGTYQSVDEADFSHLHPTIDNQVIYESIERLGVINSRNTEQAYKTLDN